MNNNETILRWEANLCYLDPEPQVYEATGDHVTSLLSDGLPQTCQMLFPSGKSFAMSIMFIHKIYSTPSPKLSVIGRYIHCSPITGLWMFAMGDSGDLHPCTSYTGVDVDDHAVCRYRCNTNGPVNYIVAGISDRHALPTSDTAVICDITLVWGPSSILGMVNSSPTGQNGRHFGRRQFKMHFFK